MIFFLDIGFNFAQDKDRTNIQSRFVIDKDPMNQIDDKRQAILKTTLRLIAENGFHGTAMSKVAKEAGVSTGIIYHYFKGGKDELVLELYRFLKGKCVGFILDELDISQPLSAQMKSICEASFRYSLNHPMETLYLQQFYTSPYHNAEIQEEIGQCYAPLKDIIERAREEMIIKDFPDAVIGSLISDVATSLAQKQAVGLIELNEELVDSLIGAIWEAIRR